MAEDLQIVEGRKEEIYNSLLPQIEGLISGEPDLIANLGNIAAALKEAFRFLWVGFYLDNGQELVLGPFQGPVACTRISYGKGVCGTSFQKSETLIVPNVEEFPGHIACSSKSRSEIVVPIKASGTNPAMVLDIDSEELNSFDQIDKEQLEKLAEIIEGLG